ncbi:MAG: PASTA domain-containing protein [Myxococcales bacterium]|nr:PASTA domain-containing protein [Myxococcales bacterium]
MSKALTKLRKLVIPDLAGLKVADAHVVLRNLGFVDATEYFVDAYEAEGTIVQTDPPRGQMVSGDTIVKLFVSRASYVRYLPTIYQAPSSPVDVDFLRRFLRIFQHVNHGVRERINTMASLFRPLETEPEFLPWLAGWLALTLDPDWPLDKKRLLIRSAARLYGIRGTSRALVGMLEIFTGVRPKLLENEWPYRGFRVGVASTIGIDTIVLPPMNLNHCFVVKLPLSYDAIGDEMLIKIHTIIQNEKPSHTTYFLQFQDEEGVTLQRSFMQIGIQSRIGDDEGEAEPTADGGELNGT